MHCAFLNAGVVVGKNCIINTRAHLEHDVHVGDHCHISTSAVLNGDVTVEAFYYGVPVSFLMSTNLSHWNILNVLLEQGVVTQKTRWEDILNKPLNLESTPEKVAIPFLEDIANKVLQDKKLLDKAIQMLYNMFLELKSSDRQKQFITTLGTNGAEVVSKTLMDKWDL